MTTGPSEAGGVAAAGLPDRIAFLGLGLIGGSVALALREAGVRASIAAWTPSGHGPAEGLRRGIVDEAAPSAAAALDGAGLVVLAGPPLGVLASLRGLAGPWRDQTAGPPDGSAPVAVSGPTITDVASTKARIVSTADEHGLTFVGGHPMAGRETTGFEAAMPGLFVDRPWVIVPGAHARASDIATVEALAVATGARPVRLDAIEHDAAVAAISHLPLVVAAALVESVVGPDGAGASTWPIAQALAATGWADMTRLAKGDPEMGAGILTTNGPAVVARLRAMRDILDGWIEQLDTEAADAEGLRRRLESARAAITPEAGA